MDPAGARVASCVGGMDVRREQRALADGCHIVVGTPGRLRDHLERGPLRHLEAARGRARRGRRDARPRLPRGSRIHPRRHAGGPPHAAVLGHHPARHRRAGAQVTSATRCASTRWCRTSRTATSSTARSASRPTRSSTRSSTCCASTRCRAAMVFCATREAVRHLQASLLERGFSAVALSGELSQSERTHALQSLRDGRARVCVATDVAARGIDLPDLGLVIHAELPNDHETLLHRSGRTGRAGRKGICVAARALHPPPQGRAPRASGRRRRGLGGPALGGRDPPARPRAAHEGPGLQPKSSTEEDAGHGARRFSPSARPRRSPPRSRASTAPACRRPKRWSMSAPIARPRERLDKRAREGERAGPPDPRRTRGRLRAPARTWCGSA